MSSVVFQKLRRGIQRAEADASNMEQIRRNQANLRALLRQEDQSQAQVQALLRRHHQCLRQTRLQAMERDMRDLVEMFHQFRLMLAESSRAVDRIELQVADAKETIELAATETHAASKHASRATFRYAVLGAAAGAILGAPVGLGFVGVSVGTLTGLILSSTRRV